MPIINHDRLSYSHFADLRPSFVDGTIIPWFDVEMT